MVLKIIGCSVMTIILIYAIAMIYKDDYYQKGTKSILYISLLGTIFFAWYLMFFI